MTKTKTSTAKKLTATLEEVFGMAVAHARRNREGVTCAYLAMFYGEHRATEVRWNPEWPFAVWLYKTDEFVGRMTLSEEEGLGLLETSSTR